MTKPTIILGLESSCDETAAAIVADGHNVLSNVVASQIKLHEKYGGVVPEIAARAHLEHLLPVLESAFEQANLTRDDIDAVAVANCPGLTPALIVAVTAAKTLAWVWQKPLIAVNHVHSHLQSVLLEKPSECFPALALIVSGGHTSLYHCANPLELKILGRTIDDAAGEAFDKVAMILNLPYPGGPSIEKCANNGNPKAIRFPRSMLDKDSLDFSFSGIKTAVLYHCRGQNMLGEDRVPAMSDQEKADIAASFQAAVVDVLVKKTIRAAKQVSAKSVMLGGGVAANTALRNALQQRCDQESIQLFIAQKKYCTDNAAMIAGLAYHKLKANLLAPLSLEPQAQGA
ncbi:MAG: tRNA (adenosine(37)-N6)-threonylcarbamoyltransferase complex transferase subunit TsaD [Sedimentisphaerales bacterium]|nr:tRNA (adenosine(37)-N6)-threonylcarbamoyltransferase complex transferase subunit TsaD [Sedimentisphaerales bacterium]